MITTINRLHDTTVVRIFITVSSRCDTYKEFKALLNVEKYLCIDIPFFLRKAFARFRCSSHKIQY